MEQEARVRYWSQHIEGWRSSGLSQRRYCEREGIVFARVYDIRGRNIRDLNTIPPVQ